MPSIAFNIAFKTNTIGLKTVNNSKVERSVDTWNYGLLGLKRPLKVCKISAFRDEVTLKVILQNVHTDHDHSSLFTISW